jgi:hypothetical protein
MKTPAREPAFQKTVLSPSFIGDRCRDDRLSIIMTVLPVVPALFPADVLAMNPMMPLAVARTQTIHSRRPSNERHGCRMAGRQSGFECHPLEQQQEEEYSSQQWR